MQTINACQRGHRYRSSILHPGQKTSCPQCDRLELVALAYGDMQNPPRACRLLDFKTEGLSSAQHVVEILDVIGGYNRFSAKVVARELLPILPKLTHVAIGREGSPVIYAGIPYWTHQAIEWQGSGMGVRISEEERQSRSRQFLEAMRRAEADELSDEGYALRAWWD